MFCIHHLAVDGVSWRILSEDLETAIDQLKRGEKVKLPEKTASFIEWSHMLNDYGRNISLDEQKYWKNENNNISDGKLSGSFVGESSEVSLKFNKEITSYLLMKSSNIYGAKIDEVLLAGLARAVGRITGQKSLAVKLEGHGREEIHKPIIIDRTVGWFTNIYAVNIECLEENDEAIISAKDKMRSIPHDGIGYAFIERTFEPDICFNYLGDISEMNVISSEVITCGDEISKQNMLPDDITINGHINAGVLTFTILCQNGKFGNKFLSRLSAEFERSVTELAEYCAEENKSEQTISDMNVDYLDDNDLTFINSLL
jgi:non-ribosomal peptide synthase protein (TIGR01720 family)